MPSCSFGQALVEGGEPAGALAGELGEVGVGDLPVTGDPPSGCAVAGARRLWSQ
jgi:hypothetical protein